jgi:hypothetical protein
MDNRKTLKKGRDSFAEEATLCKNRKVQVRLPADRVKQITWETGRP